MKDTLMNSIKERYSNPFLGSYVISFIIYNWKITLILLSTKTVDEKIIHTESLLCSNTTISNFFLHPLLAPLFISLFYLLLFPLITRKAYQRILAIKTQTTNDIYEQEKKLTPIAKEIETLENKLTQETDKNNNYITTVQAQQQTIKSLKDQVQNLEKELQQAISKLESSTNQTKENSILELLSSKSLRPAFKHLANNIINEHVYLHSDIAKRYKVEIPYLLQLGLIERVLRPGSSTESWILTDLGLKILSQL